MPKGGYTKNHPAALPAPKCASSMYPKWIVIREKKTTDNGAPPVQPPLVATQGAVSLPGYLVERPLAGHAVNYGLSPVPVCQPAQFCNTMPHRTKVPCKRSLLYRRRPTSESHPPSAPPATSACHSPARPHLHPAVQTPTFIRTQREIVPAARVADR